ncbi:MAG TPA: 23S rRNA (guanosine(2251)-2'-O)-methyltransferase RlmB [Candidatus Kapabacteria bacterium]|nr:23S rRNA (guanosine(2251)-2'-O)-methyltransferase RlmB [Candidatus Kapabacteria bacterium]
MSKRFSGPPIKRRKSDGTLDSGSKRKSKPTPVAISKANAKPAVKLEIKLRPEGSEAPKREFKPSRFKKDGFKPKFGSRPPRKGPPRSGLGFKPSRRDTDKPSLKLDLGGLTKRSKEEPIAGSPNYVVGRRAAIELLKNDVERAKIEKVYLAHGAQGGQIIEIQHYIRSNKIASTELDRRRFGELEQNAAGDTDSQGVIILLSAASYWEIEDLIPKASLNGRVVLVALDGIEDPHNIGAIIRSAEALGATGIVMPKRGAVLTPAVYKTSAGAALHLPIVKVGNLSETLVELKEKFGFTCIGLAGEGGKELTEISTEGNVCLVIGSEEKGMHLLTRKRCDELVRIPLGGKTESLNASVAAAIAMYQVLKIGEPVGRPIAEAALTAPQPE